MSKSEDKKIMAIVAGIVLLGIVGVAVIGGLASRDEAEQSRVPAAQTRTRPAPASYEPQRPSLALEPVRTIEPEFAVQPGENFVARGIETYQNREFDKAAAYFGAEVAEHPERGWPQYMLGLSQWKSGELDAAAAAMTRASEIDGSIKSFVNLSRIENDRESFDAALAAAREALAIDAEDAVALFLEGRSLRNLGEREQAVISLQQSVAADPENGYALNLLGLTLLELDREGDAVAALSEAARLQPEVAFIRNNLGMALEHQGERAQAVLAYGTAVELDGAHENAAVNLARLDPAGTILAEAQAARDIAIAEAETETEDAAIEAEEAMTVVVAEAVIGDEEDASVEEAQP